jgi:colanic acid/amylovoran biosynthesis glycosyltransferase
VNLVYVTSRYPYGPGETFLGPEIAAHAAAGANIHVFPVNPRGDVCHGDAAVIAEHVERSSAAADAGAFARHVLGDPHAATRLVAVAASRQGTRVRFKNLAALTRIGALISRIESVGADHVHVHWGGTSSTVAMAAAEAVGVPWSMTLHRWDIHENNLLARKIGSASFTRVISERGADDVRALVPSAGPLVLHMGVELQQRRVGSSSGQHPCRLVCVALLVPVKNHAALISALAEIDDATLELVGAGPREEELRKLVSALGVSERVRFSGLVDHNRLLARMAAGDWDGIVLASGSLGTEHEGIPVSLMEAMAAGIPAIATDSGGTRELVTPDSGILVAPGDHEGLVRELRRYTRDGSLRARLAEGAVRRIEEAFDVNKIAGELRSLFAEHVR